MSCRDGKPTAAVSSMRKEQEIMPAILTRRGLLRATGAALVTAPFASACGGSERLAARCATRRMAPPPLDDAGAEILRYASLAASSHNTQPWRVHVREPRRWMLAADLSRRLPAIDPDDRELKLSLGAFLENLVLAAGALGWEATVEPRSEWPEVAEISLVPSAPSCVPLSRIAMRRTLRRGYAPTELAPGTVRTLLEAANPAAFFGRRAPEGILLARAALRSFRAQAQRDDAQRELSRWIRFSPSDIERACDGLTPATMEIGGLAGWYVRHFMKPEDVLSHSFREKGIEAAKVQVAEGGGFFVIVSRSNATSDLLDAGRRFERMMLLLRENGLAGQPMSQALEEPPWRSEIAGQLRLGGAPQFLVRVGHVSPYPAPVSPRRPVGDFCA